MELKEKLEGLVGKTLILFEGEAMLKGVIQSVSQDENFTYVILIKTQERDQEKGWVPISDTGVQGVAFETEKVTLSDPKEDGMSHGDISMADGEYFFIGEAAIVELAYP